MAYTRSYTSKVSYSFPILDVIQAACAAQRINGGYEKNGRYDPDTQTKTPTNKELIYLALNTPGSLNITEEDTALALDVLRFIKGMTLSVLTGSTNGYVEAMAELSQKEVITSPLEIGLLASAPNAFERNRKRNEENSILFNNSKRLDAAIGTRRQFEIEIVRCSYSEQWNTFFITGVTEGATVFFAYRSQLESGAKIIATATVAEYREKNTKLSRVKIDAAK